MWRCNLKRMLHEEIIIAGFGGQGVLSAGKIITHAGMLEGKYVSWLPSYGAEMRGGTANCHIIISDKEVCSPLVNNPTTLIAMSLPSIEKFEKAIKKNGVLICDKSLVHRSASRDDITAYEIPATEIAYNIGDVNFASIILLGKLITETQIIGEDSFKKALEAVLPSKKHYLIPKEIEALEFGMAYEQKR